MFLGTTLATSDLARRAQAFGHETSALRTVVLLIGVAVVVAALLPRRRLVAALAGISLAVAIGLTVTPFGGWSSLGFETGALRNIISNVEPHRSALTGWFRNNDGPANVLLFLPAGLFVSLVVRRPVTTALGLTALSFAIECWQSTLTTRVGSFDDVVANALGASVGAAVAAVVLVVLALAHRARAPRPGARPDRLTPVG